MARRLSKKEIEAGFWLVVIGLPVLLVVQLFEALGPVLFVVFISTLIGGVIWYTDKKKKEKLAYLQNKYKDPELVNMIFNKEIWQGETAEQLQDSLGSPIDIDEKVLKTKRKEIWKYHRDGRNRFRLRIILENDEVVGWKKR